MQIYADYIVPITGWLHHHPSYALLFTFVIALLESLAVIGTIIPGSLTMTALGMLAGSNVMRFDLTILFASLGAFVGDSLSYLIGATYRERLISIWPFTRYPNLIRYGQEFFNKHGGKSVLIGRFTGPLRSITPIIAGMLRMSHLQFFAANLISAIGWAILYLVPGYIIGAASNQLSANSAQRLFALVMGLLIAGWLLSLLLKILAQALNQWFATHVQTLWKWSQAHPYMNYVISKLSPPDNRYQQHVLTLLLLWLSCTLFALILTLLVIQGTWITHIDQPVAYFLQSLRSSTLDKILIITNLIFSMPSLMGFCALIAILAFWKRDERFLKYWCSIVSTSVIISYIFAYVFTNSNAITLFSNVTPTLFPSIHLCVATSLLSFLMNYLVQQRASHNIIAYTMLSFLFLSGFSILYLGDNWLSAVLGAYLIGFSIGLMHWIFYRRKEIPRYKLSFIISTMLGLWVLSTAVSYYIQKDDIVEQHTPKSRHYTLNQDTWWYQSEPILPIYSTNRIGRKIGVFNIQYAGSIHELQKRLGASGWKKQPHSFIASLIIHAEGRYTTENFPFMEQLYLNRNPVLTMTYRTVKDDDLYILRLWRSNYHLLHYQEPIWLGNIILARKKPLPIKSFTPSTKIERHLFVHILPAVHDYQITRIPVNDHHLQSLPYEIPSELLIIKN